MSTAAVGETEPGADRIDLAVICVTYNSAPHIGSFLQSLDGGLAGLRWRLWVVDNASGDATVDLVKAAAPAAVVVQTGRNAGYAAAINAALAQTSTAPALLVLNPDVRLDAGCGAALLAALEQNDVGVAVPVQRGADQRLHPTLRRAPTVARALGEALLGGRRAGRIPALGEMVVDPAAYRAPSRADWATGSVLAISRACADAVGAWDESFFLYSEETDYALRARDCGFRVQLAPSASCEHARGASHTDPRLWSLLTANRVRLFAKRHGAVSTRLFWVVALLGEVLRSLGGSPSHRAAAATLLGGRHRASRLVDELRAG